MRRSSDKEAVVPSGAVEQQPRLVTPEAVVLSFETAGLGSRVLATLIDLAMQGGVLLLGSIALALLSASATGGTADVVATVLLLLLVTGVLLGYPIAFETLWRGRTPGKAALGLRVVTTEGAPVRFRHAAVRSFLGLIELWATTGSVAVLSVLLTRDNQRLGDLAAGTLVLRERSGAGSPKVAAFPPPYGLEAYTATLDIAGLTPDEYGAVRSFLLRAPSLPPPVRAGLAGELAGTVAARMRHTPPPWLPPEAFLACVAAATQARSAPPAPAVTAWSEAAAVWGRSEHAGAGGAAPPVPPATAGGYVAPP
jgi:uncharacterized RDD family membrane protein YckC